MKQCPQCGGEMRDRFGALDINDCWKCTDCGVQLERPATPEVSRRQMIFSAVGISLVGVPQSDSFEHREMNSCLVVLWYPPGTTNTTEGVIDNADVARECLEVIEPGSKLILPSTTDEHGNRLWVLHVFQLGESDGKSDE